MVYHAQTPAGKLQQLTNFNVKEYYNTRNNNNKDNSTKLQSPLSIHTYVESDDWQLFKQNVLNQHGKLHSAIGSELTRAIKIYNEIIAMKQHHSTSTDNFSLDHQEWSKHIRGDTKAKCKSIQKKLASLGVFPRISTSIIKETVIEVIGKADERTIQKYFDIVCKNSEIVQTGVHGSILDVSNFVGRPQFNPDKIDFSKLAPDPSEMK